MEVSKALQRVEEQRTRVTNTSQSLLSSQAILSMGPVEYVTNYLTDGLRRDAHQYAMEHQPKCHRKKLTIHQISEEPVADHLVTPDATDLQPSANCTAGCMSNGFAFGELPGTKDTQKEDGCDGQVAKSGPNGNVSEDRETAMMTPDGNHSEAQTFSKEPTNCSEQNNHKEETNERHDALSVVWLQFFKVQHYIDEVKLHILKLQEIGHLLFPDDEALHRRFRDHDCSKFEYEEVYGYVLRWTHGHECADWTLALDHHLQNNDHHPEYYGGQPMDGVALVESVVDMLSWRWVKNHTKFPANTAWLFDVEERYLDRYETTDREKVKSMLLDWKGKDLDLRSLSE